MENNVNLRSVVSFCAVIGTSVFLMAHSATAGDDKPICDKLLGYVSGAPP